MIGLARYSQNCCVIKDPDNIISEKKLNLIFNAILISRNEILKTDNEIERIKKYGEYLFVDGYGSLCQENLEKFCVAYFDNMMIPHSKFTLNDSEKMVLKQYLPVISKRKGDQCGGTRNDTSYLDPNVAPLCKAISSFDGISTFSSCEGHIEYNGESNYYVLFTTKNQECLNVLTKELWKGLELVCDKYQKLPQIQLMFDYGHWENVQKTYYELRIRYGTEQQGLIWESMQYLADYLIKEKKNNV